MPPDAVTLLDRYLRLQGEARFLGVPDTGPPVDPVERPERFLVRKLGSEFLVAARDIERLEASENYVNLHVRGHCARPWLRSRAGSIRSASCAFTAVTSSISSTWCASSRSKAATRDCN